MILRNLFLPDNVRGYYIFPVRILGFEVSKTNVHATQIYCKGRDITVEKYYDAVIETANPNNYQEYASSAIKNILDQAPSYDSIICALPSSQAIFKELKLPFIGLETIRKVMSYEVEPLLPFTINDAVIDGIVTKEIPQERSSEILIAAVQNQYMAQHLALFEAAGAQPEKVTLDLFAMYGLYRLIPAYIQEPGGVVLLEIELESTRMAYIYDGQLRFIRTLPKGLLNQATSVAKSLGISEQDALDAITRYGLETDHDQKYVGALREAFNTLFSDVSFTLQSFTTQAKPSHSINKIILFGASSIIKGLPQLVTDLSHIPTEIFSLNSLAQTNVHLKNNIPQPYLVSFAAALPLSTTTEFNLRQKEFAPTYSTLFMQQVLTGVLLFSIILGSLLGFTFWQVSKLKKEAYQSEQEAIDTIKEHIKQVPDDANTLDEALESAKNIVNQEERVWSAFSSAARSRFLEYLLELTSKTDKSKLGLDVERLTITPETIVLRAKVLGYDELIALEKSLNESKLFKAETVHDPNFATTGMIIRINKKSGPRGAS